MMSWSCKFHAMPIILWIISICATIASSTGTTSDRLALLAFKDEINSRELSSWNDSIHYCDWNGIKCSRRHRERVTVLNLESLKLEGTLSSHIGNLSFLREIRLGENYFHGPIPPEIGRLSHLQILSLFANSFSGEIPTNLTHCTKLQNISLTSNRLSGRIPLELTSLPNLTFLYLDNNQLTGNIPSSLKNLSTLTHLIVRDNKFNGSIPDDLCQIQSLQRFNVGLNNLTGKVPSCLYNFSHITHFSIAVNQLDGNLPSDIGLTLPNLQVLLIGGNNLMGLIPLSFPNASKLKTLGFSPNSFRGQVPGNLGELQFLKHLLLFSNQLGGSTSGGDLGFITSLTNCSNLELFQFGNNSIKGSIPNSMANLSTKLINLEFGYNQLYGSIPSGIGNLFNLNSLAFSNNYLTGDISNVIGTFSKMNLLDLGGNQFSGNIPDSFRYNSTLLEYLHLSENKLHGKIPQSLGNCQSLSSLRLSNNRLSSTIPKQFFSLSSLKIELDLSNNALSGSLPSEVGNLSNLVELKLSNNRISGHLPNTFGNILTMERLSLGRNIFTGSIPQSLRTLHGLQRLDLSHNKLSGEIPLYLENLTSLTHLDLSYNDLKGPIPKGGVFINASAISVVGNDKLCGGMLELKLPPCDIHKEKKKKKKKKKSESLKVVLPVIIVSIFLVSLLCIVYVCYRRRMMKAKPSMSSLFTQQFTRVSYAELLKATSKFSADNLLGTGSFGSVYKGVLAQDQTIVAVKVINLQQRGAFKSFISECNALKNLRHRNLVKIITACSSIDFQGNDFKALVFEFMPNGSLEEWLHPKRNEQYQLKNLNLQQRLKIAIDVASALNYLHNDCQPAFVHCDIKPSNVLLDDNMTAHVADFGLAKIFSTTSYNSPQSQGSSIVIKGSIGYVAPEYGISGEVSMQGDVYSYGIMLLEMFTGKRPTHEMFQDGQNLHCFTEMALPEQAMNIVDETLLSENTDEAFNFANQSNKMQELVSLLRLGVACSAESPTQRMNIAEVVSELYRIRDYYQDVRVHIE